MPILRADVPSWATPKQLSVLRSGLRGCVERTWAREHIWVSVRGMHAEPGDPTVILTIDLRAGRGEEQARTQALFDQALALCDEVLGTTGDKLILLVRTFGQENCISGGAELPPLSELTPQLGGVARSRRP